MKNFFLKFVGSIPTTAQQPNSPTAQQPNSPTAQQPNSPTAQQPNNLKTTKILLLLLSMAIITQRTPLLAQNYLYDFQKEYNCITQDPNIDAVHYVNEEAQNQGNTFKSLPKYAIENMVCPDNTDPSCSPTENNQGCGTNQYAAGLFSCYDDWTNTPCIEPHCFQLSTCAVQAKTGKATACVCSDEGLTEDCLLLPDLIPSPWSSSNYKVNYQGTIMKGVHFDPFTLKLLISSDLGNLGHGPIELKGTNDYVCCPIEGSAACEPSTETAPCPLGYIKKQKLEQYIYKKMPTIDGENELVKTAHTDPKMYMITHPEHDHLHVEN